MIVYTLIKIILYINYPVIACSEFNSFDNLWHELYCYYCQDQTCDHTNPNCYEMKNKNDFVRDSAKLCSPSPSYEWCIKNKLYPKFILDIAISHKGCIVYGIEVVDENKISENRKNDIQKLLHLSPHVKILEISAEWILKQTKKPKILQVERYITAQKDILSN